MFAVSNALIQGYLHHEKWGATGTTESTSTTVRSLLFYTSNGINVSKFFYQCVFNFW